MKKIDKVIDIFATKHILEVKYENFIPAKQEIDHILHLQFRLKSKNILQS